MHARESIHLMLDKRGMGMLYECRATFSELADSAIARTSENRIMNDCRIAEPETL